MKQRLREVPILGVCKAANGVLATGGLGSAVEGV